MIRFEDRAGFQAALAALPEPDAGAVEAAAARQAILTKPAGSLGRLEDIALFMAGWQGRERPRADRDGGPGGDVRDDDRACQRRCTLMPISG